MNAIAISAQLGHFALWLLTANILMGLLLSVRYNPLKRWPHRRINYFTLHNWTGYIALVLSALHAVVVVFSSTAGWTWLDVVWPVNAPQQAMANVVGAVALYLLAVIVLTSYMRRSVGRDVWKFVHYGSYICAALFFYHGIVLDPKLLDRPLNPIDAEKVSLELCLLIVIIASVWRAKYALQKRAAHRPIARLKNWDEPVPTEWAG
jgi:predicted ferric reductase